MRGTASHDVLLQDVFVSDAAVSVRRPSGAWHPIMHLISMVAFPLVYAVYTGIAEAAFNRSIEVAKRKGTDEQTTNEVFTHRGLIARSALRTVELALEATGGASYFREQGIERLFRDIQGARFHPLRDVDQRRLAGRMALSLPIDG